MIRVNVFASCLGLSILPAVGVAQEGCKALTEVTKLPALTALLDSAALVANLPDTVETLFDPDLGILVAEGGQLPRRGIDTEQYARSRYQDVMPPEQQAIILPHYRAALEGRPREIDGGAE